MRTYRRSPSFKPPYGPLGTAVDVPPSTRRQVSDRVGDDPKDVRVLEDGVGLMPRAEVEDLSGPAIPHAAASEDFAAGKTGNQDQLVGGGHIEGLAVHLGLIENDACANSLDNGVTRGDDPEYFPLSRFAPAQRTACAHEAKTLDM